MSTEPVVHFRIRPARPSAHLFEIRCRIATPDAAGQRLRMPAWIPGSYMIRDFARNVIAIEARCDDRTLELTKLDKSTWQVASCDGPLDLRYEVYAFDLSVRGAHLDNTHGFFNGTSVFLEPLGLGDLPMRVYIEPPPEPHLESWRVATTLPRVDAPAFGFGEYRAADYAELVDHPVEMGQFDVEGFDVRGVRHEVVLSGRHRADTRRLCADLARICEQQAALFGGPLPFDRYCFLTQVVGDGYGGLEHRASSSLVCSRKDLPLAGEEGVSSDYRRLLGLFSHEYFHAWNVKRIRPAVFTPYDLTAESHTRQLWAFEGITSYYDDLALVRSGVITVEDYLDQLAQTITRVLRGPGRRRQSVAESSFDAWTRFYKADENAPNAIVSYYSKGSLIALALDLLLRRDGTEGASLDAVMRQLWDRYGSGGEGVPEGGVERAAEELGGGVLDGFFQRYLHGTEDPPLEELLGSVGIELVLRPARSMTDPGGAASGDRSPSGWLGLRASRAEGGVRLDTVHDLGPAQEAGLAPGDVLIALDGLQVTSDDLDRRVAALRPGERVSVHAFRRDELLSTELCVAPAPSTTCELHIVEGADAASEGRRRDWLARA